MQQIDIEKNKQEFIELINSIEREFNKEKLINKLLNTDFFTAPASAKYHLNVEGGLCQHSLNVYNNLKALVELKGFTKTDEGEPKEQIKEIISDDSIKIVALLHDISKINTYKIGYRNVKVYCDSGTKEDGNGKFSWVTEKQYEYVDDNERFIYGSHEDTSEFMVGCFIPLTVEESIAIKNHHGAFNTDDLSRKKTLGLIFERYRLAVLLHLADSMSTYIDERM